MIPTRPLCDGGPDVSVIGFGAWAIGGKGYGPVAEVDAIGAVEAYLDAGGNFVDTARGYADSERILGDVLSRRDRDSVVIATKSGGGSSRDNLGRVREDLETSLRLLKTDHVDLLQLHSPPEEDDLIDAALGEVERLVGEGKARFAGASVKGPDVTPATQALARRYIATGRCHVLQLIYSPLRPGNAAVFDEAIDAGVGVIARTALESGFLTGKYAPGHRFGDGDHRARWGPDRLDPILRHVADLAPRVAVPPYSSPAEAALRFAIKPAAVRTVIVSGKTADQVRRNLAVLDLPPLTDAQRSALDAAALHEAANTSA